MDDVRESVLAGHIARLATDIGPRPIGTRANERAAEYVEQQFRGYGLEPTVLPFEVPSWSIESTRLSIDGVDLEAKANTFSPPCDVTGTLVSACTLRELEQVDIAGRVLLLQGELSKQSLSARNNPINLPEDQLRMFELWDACRPAAVLFASLERGTLLPLISDADLEIPTATVPPESAVVLVDALGRSVRLAIRSRRSVATAHNVVARTPPTDGSKIVVCAHFDTQVDTPGAIDNAGGTAALLHAAEILSRSSLAVSCEFVAWNDEEYYGASNKFPLADASYWEVAGSPERIVAAVNLDGVGSKLGTTTITLLAQSDAFSAWLDSALEDFLAVQRVPPWYESNHSSFLWRGVPCVAISSITVRNIHSVDDTERWVDSSKVAEATRLALRAVEAIARESPLWTRPAAKPAT